MDLNCFIINALDKDISSDGENCKISRIQVTLRAVQQMKTLTENGHRSTEEQTTKSQS